jgi:mono/diheme cytochrome c family protein
MESITAWRARRALAISLLVTLTLAACGGGGTGTEKDSGTNKTYLSVDATDADGDALTYQWRVTGGSVENRNAKDTVWTMPDGPGLHFAYVTVSDGKGGYAEQQYAVASDTLGTTAPARVTASHTPPPVTEPDGATMRLRFVSSDDTMFATTAAAVTRSVYLADVQVVVTNTANNSVVFSGVSDLAGEVKLPRLAVGQSYSACFSTAQDVAPTQCRTIAGGLVASAVRIAPQLTPQRNLRLHGHVALSDGAVCGAENEFFAIQSAATVQLQQGDGTALSGAVRVNRFGDYALDAAVPVNAALKLAVRCEGYSAMLDVPAGTVGYLATEALELSHAMANTRPRVARMLASGPEGNVRGKMIVAEADASSNTEPGADHFLTYKGLDSKLGACMYYRALGAVGDCDAQGNMVDPIGFDDWKRLNGFKPGGTSAEVSANYINRRDLNLVRRMVATQSAPKNIAFYVCNHPGPLGSSQKEVDDLMASALNDEKRIACVAMEWSVTAGVNGDAPFTKFFTFGPTGALLASINLDGRGEKYMPGACVACHGGSKYNGRFPEKGAASAQLGAGFLPFDTGNYLFGSDASLTEASQSAALFELNRLVRATEADDNTATSNLIKGWYGNGTSSTLDKNYVPISWAQLDAAAGYSGAARFYREVVGTSCRTCHTSLGPDFDWDAKADNFRSPAFAKARFCGGDADVAINASMPNALTTHDRLFERARADPSLAALMTQFLGCSAPLPDPAYPQR